MDFPVTGLRPSDIRFCRMSSWGGKKKTNKQTNKTKINGNVNFKKNFACEKVAIIRANLRGVENGENVDERLV